VYFANQNLFFIMRSFGDDPSKWIAEERATPELQPVSGSLVTANISGLKSHAVHYSHINAVGDGMRTLNGPPCIMLGDPEFSLLRWVPSNRGRIKQNARALQSGQPCAFGVPLIPTNQSPHAASISGGCLKSQISRSEVILFVVEGIIR